MSTRAPLILRGGTTSHVGRYRSKKKRKATPQQARPRQQIGYANLPLEFVLCPPICSARKPAAGQWTPFDMAVACALLPEASRVWRGQRHDLSLVGGQVSIQAEKAGRARFRRRWEKVNQARDAGAYAEAPTHRGEHKPEKVRTALKDVGRRGYRATRIRLKREGPSSDIAVRMTTAELLRRAGFSDKVSNRAALKRSLLRLSQPVTMTVAGDEELWPPLVTSVQPGRPMRIEINCGWMKPPYKPVITPLPPVRSHGGLVLYLLQRVFRERKGQFPYEKLLRLMGLDHLPQSHALRSFRAIHGIVNRHYADLHRRIAAIEWIDRPDWMQNLIGDEPLPTAYKCERADRGNAVRFIPQFDEIEPEQDKPAAKKIGKRTHVEDDEVDKPRARVRLNPVAITGDTHRLVTIDGGHYFFDSRGRAYIRTSYGSVRAYDMDGRYALDDEYRARRTARSIQL